MNRAKKAISYFLILCLSVVSTGCMGPFNLTNVTYQWNQTIGSKWVNEVLFVLFIPVYAITFVIDGFILNPIEFWSDRPGYSMKEGEQKKLASKDGKVEYLITRKKDGYHFEQVSGPEPGKELMYKYDPSDMTWYLVTQDRTMKLAQLDQSTGSDMVRVFQEDGTTTLVDVHLRSRTEILDQMQVPTLSASAHE